MTAWKRVAELEGALAESRNQVNLLEESLRTRVNDMTKSEAISPKGAQIPWGKIAELEGALEFSRDHVAMLEVALREKSNELENLLGHGPAPESNHVSTPTRIEACTNTDVLADASALPHSKPDSKLTIMEACTNTDVLDFSMEAKVNRVLDTLGQGKGPCTANLLDASVNAQESAWNDVFFPKDLTTKFDTPKKSFGRSCLGSPSPTRKAARPPKPSSPEVTSDKRPMPRARSPLKPARSSTPEPGTMPRTRSPLKSARSPTPPTYWRYSTRPSQPISDGPHWQTTYQAHFRYR